MHIARFGDVFELYLPVHLVHASFDGQKTIQTLKKGNFSNGATVRDNEMRQIEKDLGKTL